MIFFESAILYLFYKRYVNNIALLLLILVYFKTSSIHSNLFIHQLICHPPAAPQAMFVNDVVSIILERSWTPHRRRPFTST